MTAAAILLAVAIGAFSTSSISFIQQIGVATATGVLIDAFVVRTLLVPSLMALLGRWNWWSPRPLRRLHARIGIREAPAARRTMSGVLARLAATRRSAPGSPVVVLPPCCSWPTALLTDDRPGVTALGVVAAYVGCLPLVLRGAARLLRARAAAHRRRRAVLFALEPGNTVVLIPMVALVQLASAADRRQTSAVGLAVVPCVIVSVLPFADDAGELVSVVLRNVAFCLLALAVGDTGAQRRRWRESTRARRTRRLGEERLRIAREVHDVVAHAMVAINVQAGVAAHLLDRDPEQARSALRAIKATSGEALRDLRATLGVLRGDDGDAPVRPAAGLGDLDELAAGRCARRASRCGSTSTTSARCRRPCTPRATGSCRRR